MVGKKMKNMQHKKILKRACVLLIAVTMILSMVAMSTGTNDQSPTLMMADTDYVSHPQQTNTFDPDWIHFDDGMNVNALGLTQGGTFEFAARFTPDELADWGGYQILAVRHHHGWVDGSSFWMKGNIKIYEEGTSTQPGGLITSEPFEVTDNDWFDVEISEPVQIIGDEDIWVSIEVIHNPGQYPAGCDDGPIIGGKGGWIYLMDSWSEISDSGFNVNWNIWIELEIPSEPPEKPQCPDGPTEGAIGVEYMFSTSTTDPEGDQVSYLWNWGDETPTEWTDFNDSGVTVYASHIWTEADNYNITVKAKDDTGHKSEWSYPLTITIIEAPLLKIGNITGKLFKVSTVIRNIGGVDATMVDWSIVLDGGLIILGEETNGNILCIPTGDEVKISSDLIFGFGRTVITVTAECAEGSSDTRTRDAFVFLFFIF